MKTVNASELSNLKMTAGNEHLYSYIIDEGMLKHWVGIGWIEEGLASIKDQKKYPTIVRST